MIVAGIGCRTGCSAEEIASLVRRAAALSACEPGMLATPEFKANESGLQAAAGLLGLTMVRVSAEELAAAQPRCTTRSTRAEAATGIASVAEGSALAAAGPLARLHLPRIASAHATCAIAVTP